MRKTMIKKYKSLIVIYLLFLGSSLFINFKLIKDVWKDESIKVIEVVLKNPNIFKIPADCINKINELYLVYKNVDEENKTQYEEYGKTVLEIKYETLKGALDLISQTSTKDFRTYKLYHIGGSSHGFITYAIGMEKYSTDDIESYLSSMDKIVEAIPKNIPEKDILIKNPINQITYYADYAQIIYDTDMKINQINANERKFLGKKYINKLP